MTPGFTFQTWKLNLARVCVCVGGRMLACPEARLRREQTLLHEIALLPVIPLLPVLWVWVGS